MPSNSLDQLQSNLEEVDRLFEFHRQAGGQRRGPRFGFEVINKSAIVVTCACWEAFIEDLCIEAAIRLTEQISGPDRVPPIVRESCAEQLGSSKPGKFWDIAVLDWKAIVAQNAKTRVSGRNDGDHGFTTPNSENVKRLFLNVIGLKDVTSTWYWPGQSREKSIRRLRELIRLRGEIVHRVSASRGVRLEDAKKRRDFIGRLAQKTDRSAMTYLRGLTGHNPW